MTANVPEKAALWAIPPNKNVLASPADDLRPMHLIAAQVHKTPVQYALAVGTARVHADGAANFSDPARFVNMPM